MTIKDATNLMLRQIHLELSRRNDNRIKDKDVACLLNITATTYSRLLTKVQTPSINVWWRISKLHKQLSPETHDNIIIAIDE